ncbi:MAG: type II toxin-antitoxin system RelE/ParE family toxin [Robiginitomaculum sp.]|nr:type II toxin-antitoxin system RelE/ParE family toxin [Robiginitomaculum sp.]
MLSYEYSLNAQHDLLRIAEYTRESFGLEQVKRYKQLLREGVATICQFPKIGREYNQVRGNLRRFPVQEHVLYYRIYKDYIRIERILGANQDPLHKFSNQ